jgi:hypothetical protein
MWWGSVEKIPNGWEICNGEMPKDPMATLRYKKPDLRGKFIQGAEEGISDVTMVDPGGKSMQMLSESNLPEHKHTFADAYWPGCPFSGPPSGAISKGCPPGELGFDGHYGPEGPGDKFRGLIYNRKEMKLLSIPNQETDNVVRKSNIPQQPFDNRPDFRQLFYIVRTK